MEYFRDYIKSKKKALLAFLLFFLIFVISFFLYRLPVAAVIYPFIICLLFAAAFLAADYAKSKKIHNRLFLMKKDIFASETEFPDSGAVNDKDYQELIRTAQNEILRLENEYLSKYNDMTDYYSVWAHQIKTPIASMKLTLQNEDTASSRKLNADLFRIEQYVQMVLAFLRLDSDSNDFVFREYGLDGIICSAIKKFAPDFISKKIKVVYEKTDKKIVTDEKWLSFVIEQILSNSLKYTREGSVEISVKDDVLTISDTGIGIDPGDLPRIFEKGYTGFNGRADKSASGIGLWLCKRICENLGIKISAASETDKGTAVSLDISQHRINLS